MANILVVDDEQRIAGLLQRSLMVSGHAVVVAHTAAQAISSFSNDLPDLVVLDLGLPDRDGEDVARELRRLSAVPILMLTAKACESDRIAGFEAGADDYVTKPFSPREVVLRVEAILRRSNPAPLPGLAHFGGGILSMDQVERRAYSESIEVKLTATEWDLLDALAAHPGRVWSRYQLVTRIRGYEFEGYERSIDSHVKNLRQKIEPNPREPTVVETVTGVGYRMGVTRDA